MYIHSFHILFDCGLSQDIEYTSLCYAVGPCHLSIVNVVVSSTNPQLQVHPSPTPLPLATTGLCVYESVSVLQTGSFVPSFSFLVLVMSYGICLSPSDLLHLV